MKSGEKTINGPVLGLRANLAQFFLLVAVNAFVGAMIGLERTALPLAAAERFGLASKLAALAFIASFGGVKAVTNLLAGRLSEHYGRKPLLVAGWIIALPVAPMIALAPNWWWVVAANVLLGVNQGLCWSTTVIMKIDLVGPRRRGLAMGLNEFAGYLALSLAAYVSGSVIVREPMAFLYIGLGIVIIALALSAFFVKETHAHAVHEARLIAASSREQQDASSFKAMFATVSWRDRALRAVSQAGLVNNLNDGAAWGLLPLLLQGKGASLTEIALIAAAYPAIWGVAQLGTGAMSDRVGRKWMIVSGMLAQGGGFIAIVAAGSFAGWLFGATLIGLGTAAVYPALLAAVGDVVHPRERASAVGVYRLWRDLGYPIGALLSGLAADLFGVPGAMIAVAALTSVSGVYAAIVMYETAHRVGYGDVSLS